MWRVPPHLKLFLLVLLKRNTDPVSGWLSDCLTSNSHTINFSTASGNLQLKSMTFSTVTPNSLGNRHWRAFFLSIMDPSCYAHSSSLTSCSILLVYSITVLPLPNRMIFSIVSLASIASFDTAFNVLFEMSHASAGHDTFSIGPLQLWLTDVMIYAKSRACRFKSFSLIIAGVAQSLVSLRAFNVFALSLFSSCFTYLHMPLHISITSKLPLEVVLCCL